MTAEIERNDPAEEGVLVAQGTQNVGFSWYIKSGRLVFDYNIFTDHYVVRSERDVPNGPCTVGARFTRTGRTGSIEVLIGGEPCGSVAVPFVLRMLGSTGMDIGCDRLSPVTDDYEAPFPFDGTIHRVRFELPKYRAPGEKREDAEVALRTEMAKQ